MQSARPPSAVLRLETKRARFARTGLRRQAAHLAVAGASGAALGLPGPRRTNPHRSCASSTHIPYRFSSKPAVGTRRRAGLLSRESDSQVSEQSHYRLLSNSVATQLLSEPAQTAAFCREGASLDLCSCSSSEASACRRLRRDDFLSWECETLLSGGQGSQSSSFGGASRVAVQMLDRTGK